MKLIREHINEKFKEESDSIRDMGIGLQNEIEQWAKTLKEYKTTFIIHNYTGDPTLSEFALMMASQYGEYEYAKYLIERGVDVHKGSDWALRNALFFNHLKIAKMLLKAGASLKEAVDWDAAYFNNKNYLKNLFKIGADPKKMLKILERRRGGVFQEVKKEIRKRMNESLNEKFIEDSDPIRDMGIGIFVKRRFATEEDALSFLYANIPTILGTNKIPDDIVNTDEEINAYPFKYYNILSYYVKLYILLPNQKLYSDCSNYVLMRLRKKLLKSGYPKKKK